MTQAAADGGWKMKTGRQIFGGVLTWVVKENEESRMNPRINALGTALFFIAKNKVKKRENC